MKIKNTELIKAVTAIYDLSDFKINKIEIESYHPSSDHATEYEIYVNYNQTNELNSLRNDVITLYNWDKDSTFRYSFNIDRGTYNTDDQKKHWCNLNTAEDVFRKIIK